MSKEELRKLARTDESVKNIVRKNRQAAIRNARTMVTGAENRGRNDSYKQLEEEGLVMMKVWMATPDGRTRDWHIDMDGVEVGIKESFQTIYSDLEYPGDPSGDPADVYNCRCSMVTDVKGFRNADGSVREIAVHDADTEHEAAIAAEQASRLKVPETRTIGGTFGNTLNGYTDSQKADIERLIRDDGKSGEVYERYSSKMDEAIQDTKADKAFYRSSENKVHLQTQAAATGSHYEAPYQVHFHEYMHNIDYISNGMNPASVAYRRESDGKSFGEIINSEWDKILNPRIKEAEKTYLIDLLKGNLQDKQLGMQWSGYINQEIALYRQMNGLERRAPEVVKLREQASTLTDEAAQVQFYKDNIEKFWDANKRSGNLSDPKIRGGAVKEYCEYVKDTYTIKQRADLSDMFERYSVENGGPEYPFGFGHGKSYATNPGALEKEAFAEMGSAEITNQESLDLIKELLPESYEAHREILKGVMERYIE